MIHRAVGFLPGAAGPLAKMRDAPLNPKKASLRNKPVIRLDGTGRISDLAWLIFLVQSRSLCIQGGTYSATLVKYRGSGVRFAHKSVAGRSCVKWLI
jgi:hypothetical protein